jgi:hypothetical protein
LRLHSSNVGCARYKERREILHRKEICYSLGEAIVTSANCGEGAQRGTTTIDNECVRESAVASLGHPRRLQMSSGRGNEGEWQRRYVQTINNKRSKWPWTDCGVRWARWGEWCYGSTAFGGSDKRAMNRNQTLEAALEEAGIVFRNRRNLVEHDACGVGS